MKAFQRILAVLLCLVMSLGMISMVASADSIFGTQTTGKLVIHKLEKGENAANPTASTGAQLDTLPTGYTPMEGVLFHAYQVMTQPELELYLSNDDTNAAYSPESFYTYDEDTGSYTVKNKQGTVIIPKCSERTNASGMITWDSMELGLYLVIEADYPERVTSPCDPFLVSLPMTDPANENGWLYEVHVYPKNSTSVGGVEITKIGANKNVKLAATFDLCKYVDGEWTKLGSYMTDGDTGKTEISNLAHGEYMLVETEVEVGVEADKKQGYIVNTTPIYFTVNSNNTVTYGGCKCEGTPHVNTNEELVSVTGDGTALLKLTITNEGCNITKGVGNVNKNFKIGDTVSYNVTFIVPTNIADLKQFTIVDKPTHLKLVNLDTIKMYIDNSENEVPTNLYTVQEKDNGFVVDFKVTDDTLNFSSIAGHTIYMIYKAKILESAATENSSTNTVTLTYEDSVGVYTKQATTEQKFCKIDITKRKDSDSGALAAGVEFELYKKGDGNAKVPVTVTGSDGEYIYTGTAQPATKLVTSGATTEDTQDDGKLVVSGLPAGTYYLKETKAPEGYNLLDDYIEITVDYDDETDASQVVTKTIVNKQGFTLPQTGGIGTLMFIIIGGVLMAGGICLIVPNKKRAI